ncbi:MAG: flavin reductase [Helicobacter sp.]|uniref:flavin reductase family protein n=1 Tax=Helicobacter sp. 10-6591 TaxID=2004998 RepID=UPI000DCC1042|nr:flavin reductase [Helicobacter sp. 10-6591]MCI6217188.1 flavin reductase [Helicobacter sp.]MCI7485792.1 flavin reductase [Helicobacter sp.]MDD7567227.1 flavin reductase [Helicobacter sp.]MDY5740668.1 flavin reductase [Helicobacter sp.]RAX52431.1 hypothetical protein CCY97_07710 [Helicobacter sp. 10-6591]
MIIPLSPLTPLKNFKLISLSLVPRPIAWVSSLNASGNINLAPFSFFNVISLEPTLLSLCFTKKSDGDFKDTFINAKTHKKLTISIPSLKHQQSVQESSKELQSTLSEATEFGIKLKILHPGYPPAPADIEVVFFCEFYDVLDFKSATDTLVVELKEIYIQDLLYKESLDFDFRALGRSGRGYKN